MLPLRREDISYTYDANNNRKQMTIGNKTTAYQYNKNDELLRTVAEALRSASIVVGRANVDAQHGPRFAVASGLVHLYARS